MKINKESIITTLAPITFGLLLGCSDIKKHVTYVDVNNDGVLDKVITDTWNGISFNNIYLGKVINTSTSIDKYHKNTEKIIGFDIADINTARDKEFEGYDGYNGIMETKDGKIKVSYFKINKTK